MKKLIIVEHGAKELANRLWNDLSIYACGFELGVQVVNRTFFEHTRFGRIPHALYARVVDRLVRATCGVWTNVTPKYLPPTGPLSSKYKTCGQLYFFGWLFRNPAGLAQHRTALLEVFRPTARMQKEIDARLAPLQSKRLIGVHIKQKPFKGFEDGEFLISRQRVQDIVGEYLREQGLKEEDVVVVEVSDTGPQKDDLLGLHLLSQCSVVIGDNSTFSNLAAWFGNIPHIVTTDVPIDWPYYKDKTGYFENKYATFTHGAPL